MSDALRQAVDDVVDPLLDRTLKRLRMVDRVVSKRLGATRIDVSVPVPNYPARGELERRIRDAVAAHTDNVDIGVEVMDDGRRHDLMQSLREEVGPGIGEPGSATRVIAVGSGKGGVGKSSVTTNLAVTLAAMGKRVGVVDADIWGFSIPRMLGVAHMPVVIDQSIIPPQAHGVRAMSMDFFVGDDKAVIWRGPLLHKAMEQFLKDVFWDRLDFLLIDMPPGTGDVAISMSQLLPRAQVLLVTTPQPTAQRVAKRAGLMARKVDQELIGVVENMSWFTGDDGKRYRLFGEGGGAALAEDLGVPLMAEIPLVPAMREGADDGRPVSVAAPDSEAAEAFRTLAEAVIARKPRVRVHPELVIR